MKLRKLNYLKISIFMIFLFVGVFACITCFSNKAQAKFAGEDKTFEACPAGAQNEWELEFVQKEEGVKINGDLRVQTPGFCKGLASYPNGEGYPDSVLPDKDKEIPTNNKFLAFTFAGTPYSTDLFKYSQKEAGAETKYNFSHWAMSYKRPDGEAKHCISNNFSSNADLDATFNQNFGSGAQYEGSYCFCGIDLGSGNYATYNNFWNVTTYQDWNRVYLCFSDKVDVNVDSAKGSLDKNSGWLYMYDYAPLIKNTQPTSSSQWNVKYKIEASDKNSDGTYTLTLINSTFADTTNDSMPEDAKTEFVLTPSAGADDLYEWQFSSSDNPNINGSVQPGQSIDMTEEGPISITASFDKSQPTPDPNPDPIPSGDDVNPSTDNQSANSNAVSSPQTGDNSLIYAFTIGLFIFGLCLVVLIRTKQKIAKH